MCCCLDLLYFRVLISAFFVYFFCASFSRFLTHPFSLSHTFLSLSLFLFLTHMPSLSHSFPPSLFPSLTLTLSLSLSLSFPPSFSLTLWLSRSLRLVRERYQTVECWMLQIAQVLFPVPALSCQTHTACLKYMVLFFPLQVWRFWLRKRGHSRFQN